MFLQQKPPQCLVFQMGMHVGFEIFRNFVSLLRRIYLIFNELRTCRRPSRVTRVPSRAFVRLLLVLCGFCYSREAGSCAVCLSFLREGVGGGKAEQTGEVDRGTWHRTV